MAIVVAIGMLGYGHACALFLVPAYRDIESRPRTFSPWRFAAQENGSRGAEGRFEAKETQDYCWMWSRKAGPAAAVRLRLERER